MFLGIGRGCSSEVEHHVSNVRVRVQVPSPAPMKSNEWFTTCLAGRSAVVHGVLFASDVRDAMKWLVTILAVLVGGLLLATLKLANVKPVETSAEALREMAELREALQVCEATKRRGDVDAPAQARTFETPAGQTRSAAGKVQKSNVCLKPRDLGKPLRCGVPAYSRFRPRFRFCGPLNMARTDCAL